MRAQLMRTRARTNPLFALKPTSRAVMWTLAKEAEVLSDAQREELEIFGATNVRAKLTQHGAGRGAAISGFKCGDITRGDIEDWLAEKNREETAMQLTILRWARVAGVTGVIAVLLTAAELLFKK